MSQTITRNYAPEKRTERQFFTGMAIVIALLVFAGFAPSYYLKPMFGVQPTTGQLTGWHHFHGLVFTLWIVFLLVQTVLVATKRTDIHRRLGIGGMVLATLMTVLGFYMSFAAAKRGLTVPGVTPLAFLGVTLGDIILFPVLIGAGFYFRRRPDTHKRLMLLATIVIVTPAIARLTALAFTFIPIPPLFFGWLIMDLMILACVLFDFITLRRVHRATIIGGGLILLSEPLRLVIANTSVWLNLAAWLVKWF